MRIMSQAEIVEFLDTLPKQDVLAAGRVISRVYKRFSGSVHDTILTGAILEATRDWSGGADV